MRFTGFLLVGIVLAATPMTAAQSRLDNLAERLSHAAEDMALEGYRGFMDRDRGNRRDVEALFLAQQFSAGAALLQRLVGERRPDSELRDSVVILAEQARTSSKFGFGQRHWRNISGTLDEMARELNASVGRGNDDTHREGRVTGRMRWRGRVDDRAQIYVQGSTATPRAVAGVPVTSASFTFTSPLPPRPVMVEVRKIKGRGSVEVIQQPSRDNSFTAVIEISDSRGGSEDYEFELVW